MNFEELARCTEDFNGAQMKAVAVEAGMIGEPLDGPPILIDRAHEHTSHSLTHSSPSHPSASSYIHPLTHPLRLPAHLSRLLTKFGWPEYAASF